jgi:hypothetical protein
MAHPTNAEIIENAKDSLQHGAVVRYPKHLLQHRTILEGTAFAGPTTSYILALDNRTPPHS